MDGATRPPWWLVAKHDGGRMGVLTVDLNSDEEALPVFSFEEEAGLFLAGLGQPSGGWRARLTTAGELASVLMGPCAGVGRVLLDPLPGLVTRAAADVVGVDRRDFLDLLVSRGESRARYRGAPVPRR